MGSSASLQPSSAGGLTDVPGMRVGHDTLQERLTGCTVILAEAGAVAGVDVRGSAPGTRETALLDPVHTVERVHAVVLAGGSAFGLDTATGVVRYLEEKGIGFPTGVARVPIVPAAILFDLGIGDPSIRPDRHSGYRACQNATAGPVREGNIGAGAGATVGKLLGLERAMKGGLGTASLKVGELVVGALVAVNSVGDVVDPRNGEILAGARTEDGKSLVDLTRWLRQERLPPSESAPEHTTVGVIATNALLSKAQATKIAQMGHDGLARAIRPVHLPMDGDTLFALSTGELRASLTQVGALAAEVVAEAVIRAIRTASSIPGFPAHADFVRDRR